MTNHTHSLTDYVIYYSKLDYEIANSTGNDSELTRQFLIDAQSKNMTYIFDKYKSLKTIQTIQEYINHPELIEGFNSLNHQFIADNIDFYNITNILDNYKFITHIINEHKNFDFEDFHRDTKHAIGESNWLDNNLFDKAYSQAKNKHIPGWNNYSLIDCIIKSKENYIAIFEYLQEINDKKNLPELENFMLICHDHHSHSHNTNNTQAELNAFSSKIIGEIKEYISHDEL